MMNNDMAIEVALKESIRDLEKMRDNFAAGMKEDCVCTPLPDYFKFRITLNAHSKEEILKAIDAEIDFLKGLQDNP